MRFNNEQAIKETVLALSKNQGWARHLFEIPDNIKITDANYDEITGDILIDTCASDKCEITFGMVPFPD